jgi:hypothetical protein
MKTRLKTLPVSPLFLLDNRSYRAKREISDTYRKSDTPVLPGNELMHDRKNAMHANRIFSMLDLPVKNCIFR